MSLNQRGINASDLVRVNSAHTFADCREPPLRIGNFVRLNSGGPIMMVVDHDGLTVVVSWMDGRGSVCEHRFPIVCVHRVSVASCASAGSAAP
jgi:hypothetical protein